MSVTVKRSTVVASEPGLYISHPCLARTPSGVWLLVHAQSGTPDGSQIHPPNDPRFINILRRSIDLGRSWSAPMAVPGPPWTGVETPGIGVLSDGTLLVNQFRFGWPAVDQARSEWAAGRLRPYILDPSDARWRVVKSAADWAMHRLSYARVDLGSFVHRSNDGGSTWSTSELDIAPYQGAFSPKGPVDLGNGEVVLALGSHEHDPLGASFLVRSLDGGRSWGRPERVARTPGLVFSEPCLVAVDDRRLLVFSREETTGYVHQSASDDRGFSWSPAVPLGLWGFPVHAIRLRDGRTLIVYGRRRRPFGIRGSISADGGRTWGSEFVVRTGLRDSRGGFNLGYPSVIEYDDGLAFVAYYAEDGRGNVGIHGSYVSID